MNDIINEVHSIFRKTIGLPKIRYEQYFERDLKDFPGIKESLKLDVFSYQSPLVRNKISYGYCLRTTKGPHPIILEPKITIQWDFCVTNLLQDLSKVLDKNSLMLHNVLFELLKDCPKRTHEDYFFWVRKLVGEQ